MRPNVVWVQKWHPTFPEKHTKTFFGGLTKKRSSWSLTFVGKFCRQSSTKRYSQVWKIRANILRTPKNLLAPKPMYIYRFSNQNWMVFRHKRNRKPFWVVKSWFTIKNLEICVSEIFSHVIYWGSLILGFRNSLQSCAWPSILDNNPP